MSRNIGILMLLAVLGCGGPRDGALPETAEVDAGTPPRMSGCAADVDCPTGMLCEGCGDGFMTCVPGCRTDSQCGANMICSHNVQCLSCPCPSGYCDLDPCRDLDGDGYSAALNGTCPGKQVGDCNDAVATVHPGGKERCANGMDDDCDGRTDARDDECRDTCDPGFGFCGSSLYCGDQRFCDQGCCEACAPVADPVCGAGLCLLPGGLDGNGCAAANVCGPCQSCSPNYEPVCGRNFATYDNSCLALAAGTQVMHTGECSRGEGYACEGVGDCYYNQFCRNLGDAGLHCALIGSCSVDADCAAVTSVVSCDAGVASWVCRADRCAAVCP
jgi:hypothetical protein